MKVHYVKYKVIFILNIDIVCNVVLNKKVHLKMSSCFQAFSFQLSRHLPSSFYRQQLISSQPQLCLPLSVLYRIFRSLNRSIHLRRK